MTEQDKPKVLRDSKGRLLPGTKGLNSKGRPKGSKIKVNTHNFREHWSDPSKQSLVNERMLEIIKKGSDADAIKVFSILCKYTVHSADVELLTEQPTVDKENVNELIEALSKRFDNLTQTEQ